MIANPIIQRELLGMLRRGQTLGMFLALVAALAVLITALWPDNATVSLDGRQAQQVFGVFAYGLLVCLLLAVPAFPATAIVRERNSGTLALLLTSQLGPMDILLGKISAAVGFVLLLLVLSLPASIACFVMGGIDVAQIFKVYSLLALMSLQYAMIGLVISSYARSADSALRATYGIVLLLAILVLGPFKLIQGQLPGLGNVIFNWVYCLSPIPAITEILGHGDLASLGMIKDFDPVANYVLLASISCIVCVLWLIVRLQPALLDRSRAAGQITDDRQASVRLFRRIMYLWFFDPQRRSGAIGPWSNPIMVKEFRTRALGRSHWMMRLIGLCLIISMGLTLLAANWATMNAEQDKTAFLGGVLVVFQMALVILTTPALSAGLISVELESGGWQLLQVTRLSARQIVVGKLASVAATLCMLLVATLPGYIVLYVIDDAYAPRIINVLICLGLTASFALMLGAACSALFRKTAVTTTIAYLVLISLCAGTLLVWLGQGSLFGPEIVARVLALNPVATALAMMQVPGFADHSIALADMPLLDALLSILPQRWSMALGQIPANWAFLALASLVCVAVLWLRTWRLSQPN